MKLVNPWLWLVVTQCTLHRLGHRFVILPSMKPITNYACFIEPYKYCQLICFVRVLHQLRKMEMKIDSSVVPVHARRCSLSFSTSTNESYWHEFSKRKPTRRTSSITAQCRMMALIFCSGECDRLASESAFGQLPRRIYEIVPSGWSGEQEVCYARGAASAPSAASSSWGCFQYLEISKTSRIVRYIATLENPSDLLLWLATERIHITRSAKPWKRFRFAWLQPEDRATLGSSARVKAT